MPLIDLHYYDWSHKYQIGHFYAVQDGVINLEKLPFQASGTAKQTLFISRHLSFCP